MTHPEGLVQPSQKETAPEPKNTHFLLKGTTKLKTALVKTLMVVRKEKTKGKNGGLELWGCGNLKRKKERKL